MMLQRNGKRSRRARVLLCAALLGLGVGCQQKKQSETGKTYTSDQKTPQGGGGEAAAGGQDDAKPLNAPADTTNGKASTASDSGTSDATKGQVVAEPGAPVEHEARPGAAKTPPTGGPGGH